jgi:fructose-specific phosphotransferase system IIC component
MDFTLFQHGFQWVETGALNLDLLNDVASSGLSVAQVYKDNLFGNVGSAWDNFIRSGQVWALMIGFIVGYLFRSLTS